MPHFSANSLAILNTCDPRLEMIFMRVIKHYDCTIFSGHRGQEEQDELLRLKRTKLPWPTSRHNKNPSMAVDVAPCPIDWEDHKRFCVFGGFVMGVAAVSGVGLRWGGDWDRDWDFSDQSFNDLPHFELLLT